MEFLNLILGSICLLSHLCLFQLRYEPEGGYWLFQMGHLRCANRFPLGRTHGDCGVGGAIKTQTPSILQVLMRWACPGKGREAGWNQIISLWVIYIPPKLLLSSCFASASGFGCCGEHKNAAKGGFAHHFCLQWCSAALSWVFPHWFSLFCGASEY